MPLPKKLSSHSLSCENKVVAKRYLVQRRLGSGSFGTVFLVTDSNVNDEKKVLKQIFVGELQPDDTVDAVREARLLAKLDHPSIVHFHDSFLEGDSFFIATEFCEGGDLDGKIHSLKAAKKTLEQSLILDWFVQLTNAIWYIHERRILHRDLKTRNIFLRNNCVKLGDFGISKILLSTSDLATTVTGTPYYMSPEVLKHEGYNSKSDIWSLGVVLYEMCTLEHAYKGESLLGVMYKIIEKDPPFLPDQYHVELRALFGMMLMKDPRRRPSAKEVLRNRFIKAHMEDLSRKMTMKLQGSPTRDAVQEAEAIAQAVQPSKKKQLASESDTDNVQLTPKEKLRMKKQRKADEDAEIRKKLAAENRKESQMRYSERKKMEARVVPPWVEEHPEIFSADFSLTDDTPSVSVTDDSVFQMQVSSLSEGSRSREESARLTTMDERSEQLERLQPALGESGDIPEDPLLAETHYSQFEDFEEDFDILSSESEDEYEALVGCIEDALKIPEQGLCPEPVPVQAWDDVSAFGPAARELKIHNLRSQCERIYGSDAFLRAYNYLKSVRSKGHAEDEGKVMAGLKKIVDNVRDGFLIDQLIFLETQLPD